MPEGVIQVKGDYYYDNYPPGTGIDRVGVADKDMPQKKEVPHKKDAPQKHPHGKPRADVAVNCCKRNKKNNFNPILRQILHFSLIRYGKF